MLINNGAPYIEGDDLGDVSDEKIEWVMAAGGTGTVLLTNSRCYGHRRGPTSSI